MAIDQQQRSHNLDSTDLWHAKLMNTDALPAWLADLEAPLDDKLGLRLELLTAQKVIGSIPVQGNTQPFGLLHGGATALLVESLGSMGAVCHGYPDKGAVGVDLNITHVRSAREGRVTGTAQAVHLGRSIAVYSVEVRDEQQRLLSTGRITCQLVPKQGS